MLQFGVLSALSFAPIPFGCGDSICATPPIARLQPVAPWAPHSSAAAAPALDRPQIDATTISATPTIVCNVVARLTDEDWLPYVSKRKGEGASLGTINRERSALLHMLNIMRCRKILNAAPLLARQRGPQGKLDPTPEESQRLLLAAQEDVSPLAHRFVMVTLYTGLRHSAALNLRAGDVDVQRRILWIGKDKAGRR
ncbi:hypothetical protein [Stenotrophomonas sp. TEPEL]|uniref:hypothetical protein n=1 Tax=Stenotrophomonas sp. TEPEL TaxID=2283801 RepID=UPI001405454D|nr:hypothetical protein [Stenotrophomonas sp. TEPEL]